MFNEHLYKTQLRFLVRHWHTTTGMLIKTYGMVEATPISNIMWCAGLQNLWQLRSPKGYSLGIDEPELYTQFAAYLTTALNLYSKKIEQINKQRTKQDRIIKTAEALEDLIDDTYSELLDLFNTKNAG